MTKRKLAPRRHPIEIMLAKAKISAQAACKLMRITPQTFCKMKHCYINVVSNRKLMILASIVGVEHWELIYVLERHRRLTLDDKQNIDNKIKALNKRYNFQPFHNHSNQPLTKRV